MPVLLLNLFVVIVIFSIGLRVSGGELFDVLRKRALFVLHHATPLVGYTIIRRLLLRERNQNGNPR